MIKYKVYYCHSLGFNVHLAGTYDTREEAEKERNEVEDSMYDAWIEEGDE